MEVYAGITGLLGFHEVNLQVGSIHVSMRRGYLPRMGMLPAQDRDVLVPVLEVVPLEGVGEHHLEKGEKEKENEKEKEKEKKKEKEKEHLAGLAGPPCGACEEERVGPLAVVVEVPDEHRGGVHRVGRAADVVVDVAEGANLLGC